jgi:hypothetical protein
VRHTTTATAAAGALLLAGCFPQRRLDPEQLCADVGYALASRVWSCTADAEQANAFYTTFREQAACSITNLIEEPDTGWLSDPGDGTAFFVTAEGSRIGTAEAYTCPTGASALTCDDVATTTTAWSALVDTTPICSQIFSAPELLSLDNGCGIETYRDRPYAFCVTPSTWEDAQTGCQSRGLNLLSINDPTEEDDVWALAARYGGERWWLGLTNKDTDGYWYWINGFPTNYGHWDIGQPDDAGRTESCAASSPQDPTWTALDCGQKLPYICK